MANKQNGGDGARSEAAEFAEALKELQRGERTAQALENHLDSLEKKIEELLAQAEQTDAENKAKPSSSGANMTKENGTGSS